MSSGVGSRHQVRIRAGIWWRILLMTGMMYTTALTILDIARAAGMDWRGGYLALAVSLVPLEAYLSRRTVKRRELRSTDLQRFRLAELTILILAVEVLRILWQGLPAIGWRLERLIDLELVFASAMVLSYWGVATAMIRWFEEIDYQPSEKAPPVTSPEYDLWAASRVRHVQHTAAFQRILAVFLAGGVFILILAGLARIDPRAIIDFQRGTIRALILHVLVYFVLGLALAAEARLSLLHTRWQQDDVTISRSVARRWPVLVAGLLAISIVIALLLPVDYSVGLIDAVAYVLNVLITVLVTVMYGLMYLVGLLLFPLQRLLSLAGDGSSSPPPPTFQMPERQAEGPPAPPLLEILKTLILWLVAIGIAGYALYNFLREHGAQLERIPLLRSLGRVLAALGALLSALRRQARKAERSLSEAIARRRRRAARGMSVGQRLLRLGRLSPRELVRYYYLSTVRRASKAGVRRQPSQTPAEFKTRLTDALPEVDEDLGTLTASFEEAKYSTHPVDRQYAMGLRPHWERVRQALQRWRQRQVPPAEPR